MIDRYTLNFNVFLRDGGPFVPFSFRRIGGHSGALSRLVLALRDHVAVCLSLEHFEIARLIIGERKTLGQIGAMAGLGYRNTAGKRFRATLDCLADHNGLRWSKL